ncbi:hypothetical protein UFOVP1670_43 [uncultured Caudovirales phage]|uniref:Uncharacterized protein n=1 Tax=uncultured Caudovirales phage TaxID=2100421 RepID=A0A6J5T6P6_9CAUD|nr:hypothetical protein UFOVP1670_43 [uncultured Caudovirales phage]
MGNSPVPIDVQIACIDREIGFRQRTYKRWVPDGKITQAAADAEMAALVGVMGTLQAVAAGQVAGVVGLDEVRRGAREAVLYLVTPHMHSSKLVAIDRKLRTLDELEKAAREAAGLASPEGDRPVVGMNMDTGALDPEAYCPRCESVQPLVDGESCGRCKLVI